MASLVNVVSGDFASDVMGLAERQGRIGPRDVTNHTSCQSLSGACRALKALTDIGCLKREFKLNRFGRPGKRFVYVFAKVLPADENVSSSRWKSSYRGQRLAGVAPSIRPSVPLQTPSIQTDPIKDLLTKNLLKMEKDLMVYQAKTSKRIKKMWNLIHKMK